MSSKYQTTTYVTYQQFSTFLANVGGILQSILIFLNMVIYYINNHNYDTECMSAFYRVNNQSAYNQRKIINSSQFFQNYINIFKKTPDYYNYEKPEEKFNDHNSELPSTSSPQKTHVNEPTTPHNKSEIDYLNKKDLTSISRDIIPKNLENFEKKETELFKNTNENQILNLNDRLSTIPVSQFKSENNYNTKLVGLSSKHFPSQKTHKTDHFKLDMNSKLMMSTNKVLINIDQSEYFKALMCPCLSICSKKWKEKLELHHKLRKFLKSNLDLTNIVMKLMEVDMVKYLVLDDDQLVLSKLIMKPQVCFMPKEDVNQVTKIQLFFRFLQYKFPSMLER